jgi:thiamine pyrophosphate-dependent acetolactate synthase large subunit-like protein
MTGTVDEDSDNFLVEPECRTYPAYRPRGSKDTLKQFSDLLNNAERPAIVVGGGANHSPAGNMLLELAEKLDAPIVTTISGQGIIPDDHPLALGRLSALSASGWRHLKSWNQRWKTLSLLPLLFFWILYASRLPASYHRFTRG